MKATQVKYRRVANPRGFEHIKGSRNNGPLKMRSRIWNGPRSKLVTGTAKRLARLTFDAQVKRALS